MKRRLWAVCALLVFAGACAFIAVRVRQPDAAARGTAGSAPEHPGEQGGGAERQADAQQDGPEQALSGRPVSWAEPLEAPGLPNLHRVSADLYRGAQPTAEGVRRLKAMGIRTIVNLRSLHSDREEIGGTDVAYEHIRMEAWRPKEEDAIKFLRIATDKARTPVFVHCQHGADRTGAMVAAYRLVVQGWTRDEAIREMTEGGFGFHRIWKNLPEFVNELDVERLRDEAAAD